jgi:hypothetical protein
VNEDCLVLLYAALSYETLRSGDPVIMATPGQFSELTKFPGLKIFPMANASASRLFLLSILMIK